MFLYDSGKHTFLILLITVDNPSENHYITNPCTYYLTENFDF